MKTSADIRSYDAQFFLEMFQNVEEYGRAGQATDDNMTQTHCLLDN
jgi:hypothetical protein